MKLFLAVLINIYDLRMNGFSTETAVCLQTLHYSVLIGVANAFYAQIIHMITCRRCLQNHSHFLTRSSYIPVRYVVRYRRKVFVLEEMYSYSFTSGKTYLVIQTWRIVKCFRYPCYPTTLFNLSPSIFGGRSGILP